jgi:hypothetical protein
MAAHFDARLSPDLAVENVSGRRVAGRHQRPLRPQSSSASRLTAGASGFFILSQSGERPEPIPYATERRLKTLSEIQKIKLTQKEGWIRYLILWRTWTMDSLAA